MKRIVKGLAIRTVFNNQGWAGPCKNPLGDTRCIRCVQNRGEFYINRGNPIEEDENGYCKGNVHNDPLLEDLWCWEQTLCTRFFWGNTKGKWRYVFFGMPVYFVYVGLDNSLTLWGKSIIDKISNTPERYPIYFKPFIPLPEEKRVKGLTGVQVTGKKWGQLHFRYLDEAHEKYLASLVEGGRIQEQQAHPIISARHYEDSGIELKPNIREKLEKIALKEGREVKELIREAVARLIRDREL